MTSNKLIALLAASSALAVFAVTSASADPIVKEQQEQIGNSAAPDVDPGASKGPDKPIVTQEKDQLDNSTSTNVPEAGAKSIPHRVGGVGARRSDEDLAGSVVDDAFPDRSPRLHPMESLATEGLPLRAVA